MSPRSGPLLDGDAAVQVLDGEDLASGQPDPDDTIILDGAQVEEEGAEEVQEETEQYELTPEEEEQAAFEEEVQWLEDNIEGLSDYKIKGVIGEGTFSIVYKAVDVNHDWYDNYAWSNQPSVPPLLSRDNTLTSSKVYVALKRIYVTSSPDRILNELEIMAELRSCANISYLITAFRSEDQVIAVMPYARHRDFRDFYRDIDLSGIRNYFCSLFNALASTHAINVVHRDVKPANFLFDPSTGEGVLCDFGLAERFDPMDWRGKCHHTCPTPENPRGTVAINNDVFSVHTQPGGELGRPATGGKKIAGIMGPPARVDRVGLRENDPRPGVRANRAGTRGFRAPEVLLKCQDQTAALDVWSAGIILLAFLTKRFPLFNSNNDVEALLELTILFGKSKMSRCALLHNRTFHCTVPIENPDGYRIPDFIKKLRPDVLDPPPGHPDPEQYKHDVKMAMDLCRVCLHVDVTRRWTAEECLYHAFLQS